MTWSATREHRGFQIERRIREEEDTEPRSYLAELESGAQETERT